MESGESEMVRLPNVVLSTDERDEVQKFIAALVPQDQQLYVRPDVADAFKRNLTAMALMGRAERFATFAASDPSYAPLACEAAAKASAVYPLSIYVFDFARILETCGSLQEARVMYGEFLRRHEERPISEIDSTSLDQRDLPEMIAHAKAVIEATPPGAPSRSAPVFGEQERQVFVDAASTMLGLQMAATGRASLEQNDGAVNAWALGYIYGFIDAALQTIGQDMSDVAIGVPIAFQVVRHLFPGKEDHYMDILINGIGKDAELMAGTTYGGEQYIAFCNGKLSAPMGLARRILGSM